MIRELEIMPAYIIARHNLSNIIYADNTVLISNTDIKIQVLRLKKSEKT